MAKRLIAESLCILLALGIASLLVGCDENPAGASGSGDYIGNRVTYKFHYSDCSYLPDPENRVSLSSCQDASSQGCTPCGHCDPCR